LGRCWFNPISRDLLTSFTTGARPQTKNETLNLGRHPPWTSRTRKGDNAPIWPLGVFRRGKRVETVPSWLRFGNGQGSGVPGRTGISQNMGCAEIPGYRTGFHGPGSLPRILRKYTLLTPRGFFFFSPIKKPADHPRNESVAAVISGATFKGRGTRFSSLRKPTADFTSFKHGQHPALITIPSLPKNGPEIRFQPRSGRDLRYGDPGVEWGEDESSPKQPIWRGKRHSGKPSVFRVPSRFFKSYLPNPTKLGTSPQKLSGELCRRGD